MFRTTALLECTIYGEGYKSPRSFFDVCVQDELFKTIEDVEPKIKNGDNKIVRGHISFPSKENVKKIIMDFAFMYQGAERMGQSKDGIYYFTRYDNSMNLIPKFFGDYFQKLSL